jgi:hypothetical protein
VLKAALVIVDRDALGTEQVTGVIDSVDTDSLWLIPDTNTVCGIATTLLEVKLLNNLEILTVTITDEISVIVPGGKLEKGQTVGMNGECDVPDYDYQTDNVVIVDDLR